MPFLPFVPFPLQRQPPIRASVTAVPKLSRNRHWFCSNVAPIASHSENAGPTLSSQMDPLSFHAWRTLRVAQH